MGELLVLQHTATAGLSAYADVLTGSPQLAGAWRVVDVPAGERLPSDTDSLDGIVVLGGVMSATEPHQHPWMGSELDLLARAVAAGVPVLGICLGAQLLGAALGGQVRRRPTPEVAVVDLTPTTAGRQDPVVAGWTRSTPALLVHEDEVVRLPPGAEILLTGNDGVPAWRVGSAVAVQFHPEADRATLAGWLSDPRLDALAVRAGTDPTVLTARWRSCEPRATAAGAELLRRFLAGPVADRRRDHRPSVPTRPAIRRHDGIPVEVLRDRLRAGGTTVSVVIPARNEAATVGAVVTTIRAALMDRIAVVDELVVVDADSHDDTAAVARRAGARVVRQSEVLPHLGTGPGKGEAMWKGLAATNGDLVVYVDADLEDLRPHVVTGLLNPLVEDPAVQLTKSVYDRHLSRDGEVQEVGGGRVTELLARPALARWFPDLAGVVQPLSGEVAARRSLLTELPFVRGYGVEVAMLIDVFRRHGLEAIAQVDLGGRAHRHQDLAALGRMAAELLQVVLDRRDHHPFGPADTTPRGSATGVVPPASPASPATLTLWQPGRDHSGSTRLTGHAISVSERPPLSSIGSG